MRIFLSTPFDTDCCYFESNFNLVLLVKVIPIIKAWKLVFQSSSRNEEITLLHEFIFVFIQYFIEAILLKRCCQKRGGWKKDKKGEGHIGGV